MTTGYLSLCHVMIFEFQLRKLVLLNLIELDFQLEFQTWKLFEIFCFEKNNFEIWDF